MKPFSTIAKRTERIVLGMIALLFVGISCVGIRWGLPSRNIDEYLFGNDRPWPGEKIYRLAGAGEKLSADTLARRGADVDADPIERSAAEPILLTGTDEDIAGIYLRYRLYTYQPDEMITMMALAGMNPGELQLDPRLYQYGGLFIYPVGALIAAAGLFDLIDVRSDVVYYLDNPDEFGKFYVVARAYSAAWGLAGVVVVFTIARRLGGSRAGLLAALLFAVMPVVVCMAHEGKPHLPGAVLMLLAVLFAMRHLQGRFAGGQLPPAEQERAPACATRREFWLMCVSCGAALGMVLSSWPIFVLIPLVVLMEGGRDGIYEWSQSDVDAVRTRASNNIVRSSGVPAAHAVRRVLTGLVVAGCVYLVTNPYVPINALGNREVLESNFRNSLAMYEVTRVWQGFLRVMELTLEGTTLPIAVLGVIALLAGVLWPRNTGGTVERRSSSENQRTSHENARPRHAPRSTRLIAPMRIAMLPLAVSAAVFFVQFVLIGAGKPAEYGRFGIFTNTALVIGTACLLTRRWTRLREIVNWLPAAFVVIWVGSLGAVYLRNFYVDTTEDRSRHQLASLLTCDERNPSTGRCLVELAVAAEPAPYSCPPVAFANIDVLMYRSCEDARRDTSQRGPSRRLFIEPVDARDPLTTDGPGAGIDPMTGVIDLQARRHVGKWACLDSLRHRPTAISWANKPLYVEWGDRHRYIY